MWLDEPPGSFIGPRHRRGGFPTCTVPSTTKLCSDQSRIRIPPTGPILISKVKPDQSLLNQSLPQAAWFCLSVLLNHSWSSEPYWVFVKTAGWCLGSAGQRPSQPRPAAAGWSILNFCSAASRFSLFLMLQSS